MNIVLVSYAYPPSIGGLERQSHLLARSLVARGHRVRVIALHRAGTPRREVLDGVEVRRVPAGSGGRWSRMATFLVGVTAALVALGRTADVIQVQQVLHPAAAVSLVGRSLLRPVIARNSGSGRFGGVQLMRRLPLGRLSLGIVARLATGVALNGEMADEMREAGFRKVVRIPNGVEIPPETTPASRQDARERLGLRGPMVLFLGRLDEEKGADALLRAWASVATSSATLLVVGDGPARDQLRALAASLGEPAASIRFCGATTDPDLYLRAADVVVVPSASEGMSNVLLEAMAHARPVIASDVAGAREVIERPELGMLVPVGAARALAEAIDRMLSDGAAASRAGRAAREHVAARYRVDAMVTAYEHLYREVAHRR